MESAEQRTSDKDDLFKDIPDGGIDDDLFFFPPRSEPAAPPPPPVHEPEPEAVTPEPEAEAAEPEADAWTPPPPRSPSRQGGRPRSSSRGNIEDDLAADLDALDAGAEAPLEPTPAQVEFEGESQEIPPHDLEEGPPPRPREHRNENDRGPRRNDRGPRRDDRGGPRREDRGGRRDDRGPRRDDRGPRRDSRPGMTRNKPLIQDVFKRGQEVLVRVIKEGLGTKGPTLSTYLSIPGRYLVIMPHITGIRVSRKIEDDEHRRRCAKSSAS